MLGAHVLILPIAAVGFVRPFTESGICITLLLTRLPYGGGWLYAADLAGAALGCLGVIFILLVIDPVSATLAIGALAIGRIAIRQGRFVNRPSILYVRAGMKDGKATKVRVGGTVVEAMRGTFKI